jgi:tetratricopeptide (TPR) repeat protein
LSGVAVATYYGALGNPFVYDDHHAILENEFIQDRRHLSRFFAGELTTSGAFRGHIRPLPMLSLYLNHAAGGVDPVGYRLVNLLLHLLCGLCAYDVLRRLLLGLRLGPTRTLDEGGARTGAFLAASFFVLHPVSSLSVLLVWKRTTLFAALFFLGAVACFLRLRGVGGPAPRTGARKVLCVLGIFASFTLSLASKEIAVTLPLVLLLLELWAPGGGPTRRRVLSTVALQAPLWVGAVLWLTVFFPEPVAESAPLDRAAYLFTQAKVIWLYVGMVFSPNLIAAAYDVGVGSIGDPAVLAGGAALIALVAGAIFLRRRYPLPTVAVLWALVNLAPTSSFVPGPLLVDEDRVYLPFLLFWALLGAAFVVAWQGARWRKGIALAVAALTLGGATLATAVRCITFGDAIWVWTDALEKYPNASAARTNLCAALSGVPGRAGLAVTACQKALEIAPGSVVAHAARVRALVELGRLREAEEAAKEGLRRAPQRAELLKVAGHVAWVREDPRTAIGYYRTALQRNPWDIESLLYLAKSEAEAGNLGEARQALRYIEGRPLLDPALRVTLADLYRDLGELDRAGEILQRLQAEQPADAGAALAIALLAQARGDTLRAGPLLATAERLAGGHPTLLLRIARAQMERKAPAEAERILRGLVAARPRDFLPKMALASVALELGRRAEACAAYTALRPQIAERPSAARWTAGLAQACR